MILIKDRHQNARDSPMILMGKYDTYKGSTLFATELVRTHQVWEI